MGASNKRCCRCFPVKMREEIKTSMLSDLLSESTESFDGFDKGCGAFKYINPVWILSYLPFQSANL